eukprot:TRINITY_DN278_c0_g2_i1.p1 TRINITY_DN278_c0_g2~~TRINITY_DN278_c0_g2_i1.p1  ORF type:complete len:527 (+),score=145.83 TRINITY_DN278_c0_g2_i1:81-1661(+)
MDNTTESGDIIPGLGDLPESTEIPLMEETKPIIEQTEAVSHETTEEPAASPPHSPRKHSDDPFYELSGDVQRALEDLCEDHRQVKKEDMDHKICKSLLSLSEEKQMKAIEEFRGSLGRVDVRNVRAYFTSCINRQSDAPIDGRQRRFACADEGRRKGQLSDELLRRIDDLKAAGTLRESDIDDRCIDYLSELPTDLASKTLEEFLADDRTTMHNPASYFMNLIRRAANSNKGERRQHEHISTHKGPSHGKYYGMEIKDILQAFVDESFIDDGAIDDRALEFLSELSYDNAVDCLEQFRDCDLSNMRNPSAFLMGIVRRSNKNSRQQHEQRRRGGDRDRDYGRGGYDSRDRRGNDRNFERSRGGGRPHNDPYYDYHHAGIHPDVVETLDQMCADRLFTLQDLPERTCSMFKQMHPGHAIGALNEYAQCDLSRVRNRCGFFIGLLKRYCTQHGIAPREAFAERQDGYNARPDYRSGGYQQQQQPPQSQFNSYGRPAPAGDRYASGGRDYRGDAHYNPPAGGQPDYYYR